MRAHILERVESPVNIEDPNLAPGHPHDLSPARRDLFTLRDHMVRHQFLAKGRQEHLPRRHEDTKGVRKHSNLRAFEASRVPERFCSQSAISIPAISPHTPTAHFRL